MTTLYHYSHEGILVAQSDATYDALDGSIHIPANANDKTPLGATFPDLDVFDDTTALWTIKRYIEPVTEAPLPPLTEEEMRLSPIQFELSLAHYGYLLPVLDILATLPLDNSMQVYWRRAVSFHRFNPMVVAMANQLELTEEVRDAIFTYTGT